ncbi:MAG TPA: signal peptidase II [Kiritimatiellia bacterium]|nr:signal peptidase II [Kiritimatiellia bacterium]HRU71653.1 signal peptidase II [Kiritimatiellia bacterium]
MRVPFFVVLLTAADQLTKHWAVTRLKPVGSVPVVPGFFSLTYVENQGAAWGMLAGRQLFLIGFSLFTLAFLFWRRRQLFAPLWGGRLTFTLLTGGILGNLIDRIRLNYVVDFLDFFWGRHHFPAFNVADSAICCGVFLFILTQWHHDRKHGHR